MSSTLTCALEQVFSAILQAALREPEAHQPLLAVAVAVAVQRGGRAERPVHRRRSTHDGARVGVAQRGALPACGGVSGFKGRA